MTNVRLCITPRLLLRSLLTCFGLLFVLNFLTLVAKFGFGRSFIGFVPLFDFDAERSIPMAYTFILFVLASGLCMLAANIERQRTSRWVFLGIIFLIFGIDEFLSIHERFATPVREFLSTSGFFYFAHIIPYFVIVVALFLILFRWLRDLPKDLRTGMLISASVYLSGVFLMEGIGGWYYSAMSEQENLVYSLIVTVEESLEILGLTIFIHVVFKYLASSFDYLQIDFSEKQ